MKNFYYNHKVLVGQLILLVGVIAAFIIAENGHKASEHQNEKTRSAICLILKQADASTYAEKKLGVINAQQAKYGLELSAKFREQLAPAPSCSGVITPENAKPPFHTVTPAKSTKGTKG